MPRPATPPGELTPAAERILRAAAELFYWRGIQTVGVEAVAESAGVTKKTLYDRFGAKDELVAAYLREREQRWRKFLEEHLAEEDTPRRRLLATFDALADWLQRNGTRGCSAVNAHAELPDPEHIGRRVVAENKRWMLEVLTELAGEAELESPGEIAADLLLLHEGAVVTASMGTVEHAVRRAREMAERLLA